MIYTRTGLILNTANYVACVDFYSRVLELPVVRALDDEHSTLTCFDLGGSYLMVEPGGPPAQAEKSLTESPVCLRFNVADLDAAVAELEAKGVTLTRRDAPWGSTAVFTDPDGNLCQLRDEATFGD